MLAAIDLAAATRVAVSIVLLIRRASRVVEVSFFNADHLRSRVSAFLAGAEVAGELAADACRADINVRDFGGGSDSRL